MAHPLRTDGPGPFPSTRWSEIRRAAAGDTTARVAALDSLLERYYRALWFHLVCFARRRGLVPAEETAEDILQEFLSKKVLEERVLARVEPREKAKFRTFLARVLDNFARDFVRRDRERKLAPGGKVPIVDHEDEVPPGADPEQAFNVQWARQIVRGALCLMESQCEREGRPDILHVFEARVWRPAVDGLKPIGCDVLAEELDLPVGVVYGLATTAKRKYERCLRSVVADYCEDAAEVTQEIADLRAALAEAGPEHGIPFRPSSLGRVPASSAAAVGGRETKQDSSAVSTEASAKIDSTSPRLLASLMDPSPSPVWSEEELGEVLQRQMSASLRTLLGGHDPGPEEETGAVHPLQGRPIESLADLLHDPNPPVDLVQSTKDVAKTNRDDPQTLLPPEVATVIYYVSIAVALARCGKRITRLDDQVLRSGFRWVEAQRWVDGPTRELAREGVACLASGV